MCHISIIPFVSVVGHDATLTQGKTVVEVIAAVYIRLPVFVSFNMGDSKNDTSSTTAGIIRR